MIHCFLLLACQLAETDSEKLAPFRIAFWDYALHMSSYQADEHYRAVRGGEQIVEHRALYVYFEHGNPQLSQTEFRLPPDDRFIFFKRLRSARREDRQLLELRNIDDEWTAHAPDATNLSFLIPNFPFLNRLKVDSFQFAFEENPLEDPNGKLMRFSGAGDSSGLLVINAAGKLHLFKQWVPLEEPAGATMVVELQYDQSESGIVYLASAQRYATLASEELWRESWHWQDPRTIRPSMSLGKTLDPQQTIDIELLLALSHQVAEYDRNLADVTALETRTMRVVEKGRPRHRTVISEFSVIPLDRSPNERVELRIPSSVDGKSVKSQDDLIDLMSQDFADRRDEIARINAYSDQFDLGGSPHGFVLNQAPCFNDELLGLFDHHMEEQVLDERNFVVITSVQVRGRGLIGGGLLAFRPRMVTYVDDTGTITRVETTFDMMAPYRTRVVIDYARNHEGLVFPTKIDYALYRGSQIDESKTYEYGPFRRIQAIVETEVHTKNQGKD